jgi:hypothetical protein
MIARTVTLDDLEDLAALAAVGTRGDDHLVAFLQSELNRHGHVL